MLSTINDINDDLPDDLLFDVGDGAGGSNSANAAGGAANNGPAPPGGATVSVASSQSVVVPGMVNGVATSMGGHTVVSSAPPQMQQQQGMRPANPNINLVNALTSGPNKMQQQQPNMPMMSVNMPVSSSDMGGGINAGGINTMNNGVAVMGQQQQRPVMGAMPPGGINPMMAKQGQQQMMVNRPPNMILQQQFQARPQGMMQANARMPVRMAGPQPGMMQPSNSFPGAGNVRMGQPPQGAMMAQQGGPVNLPPRYPTNKMDNNLGGPNQQQPNMGNLQPQQQQQVAQGNNGAGNGPNQGQAGECSAIEGASEIIVSRL